MGYVRLDSIAHDNGGEPEPCMADKAPPGCQAISDLWRWQQTSDYPAGGPWWMFCDLIGYTTDMYGETFSDWPAVVSCFGYMELDYLGAALVAHADRPTETNAYVAALLAEEVPS